MTGFQRVKVELRPIVFFSCLMAALVGGSMINAGVAGVIDDANLAVAAISQGDNQRAIELLSRVLDSGAPGLTPADRGVVHFNRGLAQQNLGNLPEAIADYSAALTHGPDDSFAYFNRGTAFEESGDLACAVADFEQAVRLNPSRGPFESRLQSARARATAADCRVLASSETTEPAPGEPVPAVAEAPFNGNAPPVPSSPEQVANVAEPEAPVVAAPDPVPSGADPVASAPTLPVTGTGDPRGTAADDPPPDALAPTVEAENSPVGAEPGPPIVRPNLPPTIATDNGPPPQISPADIAAIPPGRIGAPPFVAPDPRLAEPVAPGTNPEPSAPRAQGGEAPPELVAQTPPAQADLGQPPTATPLPPGAILGGGLRQPLRTIDGGILAINFGDDASPFAADGECDDARFFGPGLATTQLLKADLFHDASDCRALFEAGLVGLRQ